MTADDTSMIATDDHSLASPLAVESNQARAERLLYRLADLGEVVMDSLDDPLDIPDYLLATMVQAASALVQLAVFEAQQPVGRQWPDLVILGDHGQWRHVGGGEYAFEGIDNLAPVTLAELRRSDAIREYALLPHTPITAQEADAS